MNLAEKAREVLNSLPDEMLDYESQYLPIWEALNKLEDFEEREEELLASAQNITTLLKAIS